MKLLKPLIYQPLTPRGIAGLRALGIDPHMTRREIVKALAFTSSGRRRALLGSSHKTDLGDSLGYASRIMYLAPWLGAGVQSCAWASPGCRISCLISSGQMIYAQASKSRASKRLLLEVDPELFQSFLDAEIGKHALACEALGRWPVVRVNGTSDLVPSEFVNFDAHPKVQFMDYTKRAHGSALAAGLLEIPNYHLTFSLDERPISRMRAQKWLSNGYGVAVVVGDDSGKSKGAKRVAKEIVDRGALWGLPVVDGDLHDLRFLDRVGAHFVILSAKGKALADETGFTHRPESLAPSTGYALSSAWRGAA